MPGVGGSEGPVTTTTKGGGGGEGMSGGLKKGPWTAAEDNILMEYVKKHGEGNWNAVQRNSGLSRCGKSCRLRWANHLRPNLKKGSFTPEEERLILELHSKLGNKWARMAAQMPGRTDNEIKNYWNTRVKRRQRAGLPLYPPDIQRQAALHRQNRPSPATLLPDHKTQFATNPNSLSLFDHLSSNSPAQSRLMSHSLFGGSGLTNPQTLFQPSAAQQNHLKGPREDSLSFSMPFFTSPIPSPPQAAATATLFRYNSGNHDLSSSPLPLLQQSQQQQPQFSVKMELPSSQFFPAAAVDATTGSGGDPWGRNNSGLLDALLEQAQGVTAGSGKRERPVSDLLGEVFLPEPTIEDVPDQNNTTDGVTWADENGGNGGHGDGMATQGPRASETANPWHDSTRSTGTKMKSEPVDEIEDLSALFEIMQPVQVPLEPTTIGPNWYSNDSGEISNGQSSGVTDDDIGLEMQQLASSHSMGAEDHAWSIGSDHWDNMPGIC